jgi:hypothetical protein
LIAIEEKSSSLLSHYVSLSFKECEIEFDTKSKCEQIQSALIWKFIFSMTPQRTGFYSNLRLSKELLYSSENNTYFVKQTPDSTKMFFSRRVSRHENLALNIDPKIIQRFIFGARQVLIGEKYLPDILSSINYCSSISFINFIFIPRFIVNKSLFVNSRGRPLQDEALLQRIRSFSSDLCSSCNALTLRSLRANFQFHFHNSNPTFQELRNFNISMDHTDLTGFIYYNRAASTREIQSPTDSRAFLLR